MTDQKRAKIGGETGTNGEFYEGGKFLPTTEQAKRKGSKPKTARKQNIAPFIWEVAPAEGLRAIFADAGGTYARVDHQAGTLIFACSEQTIAFYGLDVAACRDRIARYNAGERWFSR